MEYVRSERNGVADGLSRLPAVETWWPDDDSVQVAALTTASAVTEAEFWGASAADPVFDIVRQYISSRWPSRQHDVDPQVTGYFHVKDELSLKGELLFRGDRLVVPVSLRECVLRNAHEPI